MKTRTYKVICKKCSNSDTVVIGEDNQIFWGPVEHIISGRLRLDSKWGWQCMCGNNDLLTKQERKEIHNLQEPDPYEVAKVSKNPIPDEPKFHMALV